MRPVSAEKRTTYTPSIWANPYYGSLWGYYGYGWGTVYIPGSVREHTIVVVETTIYSVPRNAVALGRGQRDEEPEAARQVRPGSGERQRQGTPQSGLARQIKK